MDVLIAGAGIGGLTAALSLHTKGIGTMVIEGARELRPLGVGINLQPRAVHELITLGLGDELAAIGVATKENIYCDRAGATLFTEPRGIAGGHRWPQYSVHRGKLQMLLLDAVRRRIGPVRTGARLTSFTEQTDAVRVPDLGLEASVLVGADGLHSAVRAQLHPGPDPLRWSGVRMWRGVSEVGPFLGGRSMVIARGDAHTELIAYPIGPTEVNWVALRTVTDPGVLPGEANWNAQGQAQDVLAHFGDWDLGWLDVRTLITSAEQILGYPMVDRDPLPSWGTSRVTLLGDAAHPMYPVGANGASQAIIDASTLAEELAAGRGVAGYENLRRPATSEVIAANRDMQRTGPARSAGELATITTTYRQRTGA